MSTSSGTSASGTQVLRGLALVACTLVAYLPTARAGYIWDDDTYVTNNQALRTLDGLWRIWTDWRSTPQYYPLVHTTFWLEYRVWRLDPLGYHLTNVLLHALAAVLLWRVALLLELPGAWFVAAVFAVHPVHVESVAWITERKNTLSAVFYLASALVYLSTVFQDDALSTGRRYARLTAAWLLFAAAMLSKTVAASLPAALLLAVFWKRGRITPRDIKPVLPMFALGIPWGLATAWLEKHHVGALGADWSLSFVERLLLAGRAVWFYAGKLFWPRGLTFIYPRWQVDAANLWQYLYPLAALGLVAGLWALRGRLGNAPLAAALFFGGTLLPALGFFDVYPMRYSFVADHFQYLASIGLMALVVGAVAGRVPQQGWPWAVSLAGGLLLVGLLASLTFRQCHIYRDEVTLWHDTLRKNPACWMAYNNLGTHFNRQGERERALAMFHKALALQPQAAEVWNNLGALLNDQGRLDEAEVPLKRALEIDPQFSLAHFNLGVIHEKRGRLQAAADAFQRAIDTNPRYVAAHYNLAVVLLRQERPAEAQARFRQVLRLDSRHALAHHNLGTMLREAGQLEEAIKHYRLALASDPKLAIAHLNLALALRQAGQWQEARFHYEQAQLLKRPPSPPASE